MSIKIVKCDSFLCFICSRQICTCKRASCISSDCSCGIPHLPCCGFLIFWFFFGFLVIARIRSISHNPRCATVWLVSLVYRRWCWSASSKQATPGAKGKRTKLAFDLSASSSSSSSATPASQHQHNATQHPPSYPPTHLPYLLPTSLNTVHNKTRWID